MSGWALNPRLHMSSGSRVCPVSSRYCLFGVLVLWLRPTELCLLLVELGHKRSALIDCSVTLRNLVVVNLSFLRCQRIPVLLSVLRLSLKFGLLLFRDLKSLQGLSQPGLCFTQPNFSRFRALGHGRRVVEVLLIHFSLNVREQLAELHAAVPALARCSWCNWCLRARSGLLLQL